MGALLDLVQLRTFVAIAECGGFGRAASALRTSQPTVSQHVRSLERVIGRPLVERTGRATRFTAAGEVLLVEARRLLAAHDEAMGRLGAERVSSLTVGAIEHAAAHALPDLLTALLSALPGYDVVFRLDRSTILAEETRRGTLDLALILGAVANAGGREVGSLPLRWLAAPGWCPPPRGRPLPLVAFQEPCGLRGQAVRTLEGLGWNVRIATEATNLDGILTAARARLGIALLPTAYGVPPGLEELYQFPQQGTVGLRLLGRQGLNPAIEASAAETLRKFFASVTRSPTRVAELPVADVCRHDHLPIGHSN
ncbi:DNA-binding transcriptional regulator, LysR family [Streptosporangium subroseum]|uniref:DNA-binding transcriptional regulator, LysR family n=1 Tax=Streptosporangium subroseum TaxID=106412 RepID=A0A239NUX2_9ACTN|nr:LysR family transcriptional regulator [Streptosporangium subroseum]SNT58721.1 DNA-binding transcriptional regulator, LysR family [Streptosporangium subroseum]